MAFGGYVIPENTTVFGNLMAVQHDPKNFDRPLEFEPTRFIKQVSASKYII